MNSFTLILPAILFYVLVTCNRNSLKKKFSKMKQQQQLESSTKSCQSVQSTLKLENLKKLCIGKMKIILDCFYKILRKHKSKSLGFKRNCIVQVLLLLCVLRYLYFLKYKFLWRKQRGFV